MQKILNPNPQERYTAIQPLNHPWMTRRFSDVIPKTFEENRRVFQNQENLLNICKAFMLVQYLK